MFEKLRSLSITLTAPDQNRKKIVTVLCQSAETKQGQNGADLDWYKVLHHCGKCKFPVSAARRGCHSTKSTCSSAQTGNLSSSRPWEACFKRQRNMLSHLRRLPATINWQFCLISGLGYGGWVFAVANPSTWNSLPKHLCDPSNSLCFWPSTQNIPLLRVLMYEKCMQHITALYRVARKKVANFHMALCNRVGEMNQQKSMYVMSKHLRICLWIFT